LGQGLPADEALGWHRRADSGTRNFHGTMALGDDNKEEGNLTQASILNARQMHGRKQRDGFKGHAVSIDVRAY